MIRRFRCAHASSKSLCLPLLLVTFELLKAIHAASRCDWLHLPVWDMSCWLLAHFKRRWKFSFLHNHHLSLPLSLHSRLTPWPLHLLPSEPGLRPWMRTGATLPSPQSHLSMGTPVYLRRNLLTHTAPQTQREQTAAKTLKNQVKVGKQVDTKQQKKICKIVFLCLRGRRKDFTNSCVMIGLCMSAQSAHI